MIDEKRVRRMTRMAVYESTEGPYDERINSYFRGDYIAKQVILTFISSTAAFLIIFGIHAIYTFEDLISEINNSGFGPYLAKVIVIYAAFCAAMIALTIFIYNMRYSRARKHLNALYHDLRKLAAGYRRERKE